MRVSDIRVVASDDSCQLQAWVESERPRGEDDAFDPFTPWYRFPLWCEPFLSADNGDPFLAALLLPAMQGGERLTIDAPVSPRLLDAVPDIQAIYACFEPGAVPTTVEASPRAASLPEERAAPAIGLFFSLGVDSFYSLLKNRRDHGNDAQSITHLIAIHGCDVPYDEWDDQFPAPLLENFQRVATETGATLLPVTTNVRREGGRLASWIMLHGAALASVALALGGLFAEVRIAASTTYAKLFPWGSHPVLDPLWSTEQLRFIHDGCEREVIDKTSFIAGFPLALETLRPCAGYGKGYNCGSCLKCMRTMLDLLQAGALDRCQTLPHTIAPEQLRAALRGRYGPAHRVNYQRRYDDLTASGGPPELLAVLAEHLATLNGEQPVVRPARRRFVDTAFRRGGSTC